MIDVAIFSRHYGLRRIAFFLLLAIASPRAAKGDAPAEDWRQALFAGIDLSSPPLQATRSAVEQRDFAAAEHEWATYLRNRTSVKWAFDPHSPVRIPGFKNGVADNAVDGTVQGGLVPILHTFPGNKIDWLFNATVGVENVPVNYEWQWQLCRMTFWDDLARTYRATGDEKYANAWVTEFRSFADQCPPPQEQKNVPGSAWRTIDSGIRMSAAWPDSFFSFLLSPAFTDDDVARFTYFALLHGRYLHAYPTSANWVTMEMCGLFTTGCVFPELKEAQDWREFAAKRMRDEETAQFLPDGAQYELSPGYHNVALNNLIAIVRVAKLTGRLDELPEGYIAALERAYDFDLYLMTPDRSLPKLNDSGWDVGVPDALRTAFEFFPKRRDYQWVATDGNEGTPPATLSYEFAWAGFDVMRSSWDREANYLVLRNGPLGYGHWHQDKLNVLFWAYGREILFDSGGGSYEQSKWRNYELSTFGHNTILVDGKPQQRPTADRAANVSKAPINARWHSDADYDFAEGVYDQGYGSVDSRIAKHTRRVLFMKPDLALIVDTLEPNDAAVHSYQARWNLNSTHTFNDPATSAIVTQDADVPNLALVPLQTADLEVRAVSGQTDPEILGWYVFKDHVPAEVPATTVLHTVKGPGPKSLVTLLLPLRAGESLPVSAIRELTPTSWNIGFKDNHHLMIDVDLNADGAIRATDIGADGHVRRQINAGR